MMFKNAFVAIFAKFFGQPKDDPEEQKILQVLQDGPLPSYTIAEKAGMPGWKAYSLLMRLIERGLVSKLVEDSTFAGIKLRNIEYTIVSN